MTTSSVSYDEESSLLVHPVRPLVRDTRSFFKIFVALTAVVAVTLLVIGSFLGASPPRSVLTTDTTDTTDLWLFSQASMNGVLCRGQTMELYQVLNSLKNRYTLWFQANKQIILKQGSQPMGFQGPAGNTKSFVFQDDGNLVLTLDNGNAYWNSGTSNTNAAIAVVQNDGDFVIYGADGKRLWHSNTAKIPYDGPSVEFYLGLCPGPLFATQDPWSSGDLGQVGSTGGTQVVTFGTGGWQDIGWKAYPNCKSKQSAISGFKLVNKPGYVGYFAFQWLKFNILMCLKSFF